MSNSIRAIINAAINNTAARFQSAMAELIAIMTMAGYASFANALYRRMAHYGEFKAMRDSIGAYSIECAMRGFIPSNVNNEDEQLECAATWTPTVSLFAYGEPLIKVKADSIERAHTLFKAIRVAIQFNRNESSLMADVNKCIQYAMSEYEYAFDKRERESE